MAVRVPNERDWSFYASLLTLNDFWEYSQAAVLFRTLDALTPPEFWGEGDIVSSSYDPQELQRWFASLQNPEDGRPPLKLKRSTMPRYSMSVNVGNSVHPHSVHIQSDLRHDEGEIQALFALTTALASTLNVDFGLIDLRRDTETASAMNPGAHGEHLGAYIEDGPSTIWVKTFFGPRLVELAGANDIAGGKFAFMKCGGNWQELANGVLALDLHPEPWNADPKALKAAQVDLLPKLRVSTGIFSVDDVNKFHDSGPGPRWRPPPNARWPQI